MRYPYFICDVFTDTRFGGNQLAVLPKAEGLSAEQMQQIAREFNFSESTFVLPPEAGNTRRVRIFTPTTEVPFAGHPNIGTAFALATAGELGDLGGGDLENQTLVTFEEEAGLVAIRIERQPEGGIWCELEAPQSLSFGKEISPELLARAVSLPLDAVLTTTHMPRVASVGLPFLIAELKDLAALQDARINMPGFDAIEAEGITPDVHLYIHSHDEFDIRARMFAPMDGVPEDPATGSANCALAALLSHCDAKAAGDFQWRIAQGIEMGRPSLLMARTRKAGDAVVQTWIGGHSVLVSEGTIEV